MNLAILLLTFFTNQYKPVVFDTRVEWTTSSPMPANDVIYYSTEKLDWSDFRGKPEKNSPAAAVTVSGFGYKANINTKNGKGQFNIKVYCYFNKDKSWVKEGRTIPYILKHEQNHFDISYIAANYFVDRLKETTFTSSNYEAQLRQIYNEACEVMHRLQDDYDGETRNGQVREVQKKWNALVDDKIASVIK